MTCKPCRSCGRVFFDSAEYRTCSSCALKLSARRLTIMFWVMIGALLALWVAVLNARGGEVTERFLDEIAQRESGNNHHAVGAHNEHGSYQLKGCAVRAVNAHYHWSHRLADMHDDEIARAYCRAYLLITESRLLTLTRRQPTQAELYAAYRLGVHGWIHARTH